MEIKSDSTPNVCCKHSRLSSIGLCCHTMSCKTSSTAPCRHRTDNEPAADLHRTLSGNMKLTTLHWLLLVPLFAILLSDVCNGLVVDKDFLGEGKSLFVYGTKIIPSYLSFCMDSEPLLRPYLSGAASSQLCNWWPGSVIIHCTKPMWSWW